MPKILSEKTKLNGATTEALNILLKRWLSITESQICALEVLSDQLPKMNSILEGNMMDLSTSFNVMANHARNQTGNVSTVAKAATIFLVDGHPTTLREVLQIFRKITEDARNGKEEEKNKRMLNSIIAAVMQQEEQLRNALETAEFSSDKMICAITSAIVGMQFQDRVSQNLVIATNVSKEIIIYLREAIDATISSFESREHVLGKSGTIAIDETFAKKLIEYLTLGELQQKFIDHLITHGYITNPSQLGFIKDGLVKKQNGESVELF